MYDPHALKIYIDGSARNNPGDRGGYSGLAEYPEDSNLESEEIFKRSFTQTTNQRVELMACIEAFNYISKYITSRDVARVIIITDSLYVYDCQNLPTTWRTNGWKNKDYKPVENVDLWKKFITARAKVTVSVDIFYEKGKQREVTKQVDKLAKKVVQEHAVKDYGYQQGKVGKTILQTKEVAVIFPATSQNSLIRVYEKRLAGKNVSKVKFELMSEDKDNVLGKYFAYATLKIASNMHRHHYYKVNFNDDKKYPKIESAEEQED